MKLLFKFSVLSMFIALIVSVGCTPKTGKQVAKAPEEPIILTAADSLLLEDKMVWGADSNKAQEQYSLYREYFKQDAYADALPYWRTFYAMAPRARKTPYLDGEKMYLALLDDQIEAAECKDGEVIDGNKTSSCNDHKGFVKWKYKDPAVAQAYLDTVFNLLDTREEHFGERGLIAAKKGQILSRYYKEEEKEILSYYDTAIEINAEDAPHYALYPSFVGKRKALAAKEIEGKDLMGYYDRLLEIVDFNIDKKEDADPEDLEEITAKADKYQAVKDKLEGWYAKKEEKRQEYIAEQKKHYEEQKAYYEKQVAEQEAAYQAQLAQRDSVLAVIDQYKKDSIARAEYFAELEKRAAQDEASKKAAEDYAKQMAQYDSQMDAWRQAKSAQEQAVKRQQQAVKTATQAATTASSAPAPSADIGGGGSSQYSSMDCGSLKSEYNSNKSDVATLKQIYSAMKRNSCPTFDVLKSIVDMDPSASRCRYVAQTYMKNKDYANASKYYEQSLQYENDQTKKAKVYYQLAKIERVGRNNFSKARNFAQKAAGMQAGWGDPYIFIGDMYMSSRGSCSDKFDGYSVYWVAADMYAKAAQIDPSVAGKARSKLSSAKRGFPDKEKVFFAGFQPGQRYKVGCWIGQSTKIR